MAVWFVRAGPQGEHFSKFLSESRIYLTWGGLDVDLESVSSKEKLKELLAQRYPSWGSGKLGIHTGQIWRFAHEMSPRDWVVVPDKLSGLSINVAEITGGYTFVPQGPNPYFHYRDIKWIGNDIPRTNFAKDLLFIFGGLMTIFRVSSHNAEERIRAMGANAWKPQVDIDGVPESTTEGEDAVDSPDLEQLAADEVAKLIVARFKGHGLARLVEEVLHAQGYTTFRSAEGADKGVDILAGPESLGFGDPRICVQVKSGDSPVDRPTLDQLIGTMQIVGAQQGLLVSWGGFKSSIRREEPSQFFRVRLWDQKKLVEEIQEWYEKLNEDIRAELPLKRVWIAARDAVGADVAEEP